MASPCRPVFSGSATDMSKTITVKLLETDLAPFREAASTKQLQELVQRLFESLDEADTNTLLSDFCVEERETYDGSPTVADVSIDCPLSGTINVEFWGSAYFGCKDMSPEYERAATVVFNVSIEESCICFSTDPPDPEARYPDDEL
jgi:hypothetical protein